MKKVISIFTAVFMAFSLSACGNNSDTASAASNTVSDTSAAKITDTKSDTETQKDQPDNGESSDILIVYFSETGNTEILAELIHEQVGGDMFRIEPVTPYPQGEELFDYTKAEQDNDERPEISGSVENMEQYDTVFIGYPIWWYEVPQIIKTFLDDYDLSGKKVIPFNTHEGSRDGGTYDYIAEQEPDAEVLEGLPIRGGDMQKDQSETVQNWLKELGY
ncbi:MAG: NAD(P)H-dependent oxidoreductase [Oscillospiraceae bacterium]|nr:NAD(P)H-dependent oxidoreductase [Oscillospiraceae bacterium]